MLGQGTCVVRQAFTQNFFLDVVSVISLIALLVNSRVKLIIVIFNSEECIVKELGQLIFRQNFLFFIVYQKSFNFFPGILCCMRLTELTLCGYELSFGFNLKILPYRLVKELL